MLKIDRERYPHQVIEDLRAEIAKGWNGPTSKRNVTGIIGDKRKAKTK